MALNAILNGEYELLLDNVLSFLDARSVAILGSCSKQTRKSVNSSTIWHKFCLEKGYDKYYYLVELSNHSSVPPSRATSASPIYSIPRIENLERLGFWREVYNRSEHLLRNWRNGVYSIAPILKGHKGNISAFDSDGITIVSGSREAKEIKIWSISECECVNTIKVRTDSINCLKIYKNQIIVAGEDGIIRIYDYDGNLKFTLTNNLSGTGAVMKLFILGDNVLGVFSDKSIKAWSLNTYELQFILRGHSDEIECINSFENFLITGSWDNTIILWDIVNGCKITKLTGHTEVVNCLKMKKDCIVSGSSDNSVRIWNLNLKYEVLVETSKRKISLDNVDSKSLEGHTSDVNCLEIYGNYIASGGSDSLIIIWNFDGELLYKLTGHLGCVRSLHMNNYILVSGGDAKRIMIWDYKNGNLLSIVYRNPNKLNTMIVNDTKIITESPEIGSNITIICYW